MKKLAAALLFIPAIAQADFMTGNTLYSRMISQENLERALAIGYVMGISDANQGTMHCSGPNVTSGQSRDVVKAFLEKNPAVRDMQASLLTMVALGEAFPCKKGKQS